MRVPLRLQVSLLWIVVTRRARLAARLRPLPAPRGSCSTSSSWRTNSSSPGPSRGRSTATCTRDSRRPRSAEDPEYRRYLRYLNAVKAADPYITYLYTVNIDGKTGELSYAVDGDILEADTVYIESDILRGVVLLRHGGHARGRGRRGVPHRRASPWKPPTGGAWTWTSARRTAPRCSASPASRSRESSGRSRSWWRRRPAPSTRRRGSSPPR